MHRRDVSPPAPWRVAGLGPLGLAYLRSELEAGDQFGRALAATSLASGEVWTLTDRTGVPDPAASSEHPNREAITKHFLLPCLRELPGAWLVTEDFSRSCPEAARRAPVPPPLRQWLVKPGIWEIFIPDLGPVTDTMLVLWGVAGPADAGGVERLLQQGRSYPTVIGVVPSMPPESVTLDPGQMAVTASQAVAIITAGWKDTGFVVWTPRESSGWEQEAR